MLYSARTPSQAKTRQYIALAIMGAMMAMSAPGLANANSGDVKEFYINTVHLDGKTSITGDANHKPEPFPTETLPAGGGLVLTAPNKDGVWNMRAFTFEPSQIVVHEGERVRLHFVGVQGMKHTIHVEGEGVDENFQLTRGYKKTVEFTAGKPGSVAIECYDHEPSMTAQLLILPQ